MMQEHPTLNQEFVAYVGHGRVKIKPNIRELQGDYVLFEDGTRLPFDIIIYATGYNISFPFLKSDIVAVEDNNIALYRRVVDPNLPNLYFIGLLQPLGAIMPLSEIQGKWVAGLLAGTMRLPNSMTMRRAITADQKKLARRYHASPRHTIQVDFWDYIHQIEREMRRGRKRAAQMKPVAQT